jgi:actin-related protein
MFPVTLQIVYVRQARASVLLLTLEVVTSELMFEQYCVPSLTYCIDSIMSFYHNNQPEPSVPFSSDGLVISFNTASTSIIPILSGKGILSHAKRLDQKLFVHHAY